MDRNLSILGKMLEEIDYITDYTDKITFEEYIAAEDKKRVIAMTLINIGELVRHLKKDFRKENSHMPFDNIIGLRDVAAHGYKALRFDQIWNTIKRDLPELKSQIKNLIDKKY